VTEVRTGTVRGGIITLRQSSNLRLQAALRIIPALIARSLFARLQPVKIR